MVMKVKTAKPKAAPKTTVKVAENEKGAASAELQNAVADITQTHPDGSQTKEQEEVAVQSGKGPFANVGVSASRTFNLGDYNSCKIEVSLHVPCPVDEQEIEETFIFAAGWVDTKINEKSEEIEKAIAGDATA